MNSITHIQTRLTAMNNATIEKGYNRPDCQLDIGASSFCVWVSCHPPNSNSRVFEGFHGDTPSEALDGADAFISGMESVADYKKTEAVKLLGRAVDAMRAADIEAKFIDPMAEQLKALSENLLTDQRAAQ